MSTKKLSENKSSHNYGCNLQIQHDLVVIFFLAPGCIVWNYLFSRQVTSSLTAEEEKTSQKLIKEGQKANKDQTIDLLNNFKALLNNNIKQEKVKPGNVPCHAKSTLP